MQSVATHTWDRFPAQLPYRTDRCSTTESERAPADDPQLPVNEVEQIQLLSLLYLEW